MCFPTCWANRTPFQVLSSRSILLPLFLLVPGPAMSTFLLAEGGEGQDEHEINPRDFISTPPSTSSAYPLCPIPQAPPVHRHLSACLLLRRASLDGIDFILLSTATAYYPPSSITLLSLVAVLAEQHGIVAPSRQVFQRRNARRVRLPLRRR